MGRAYRPVEVESNGVKEIAVAIVDTGADETVISEKLADKLNTELHGTFLAKCASQTVLTGKYASITIRELKTGKQAKIEVGAIGQKPDGGGTLRFARPILVRITQLQYQGLLPNRITQVPIHRGALPNRWNRRQRLLSCYLHHKEQDQHDRRNPELPSAHHAISFLS